MPKKSKETHVRYPNGYGSVYRLKGNRRKPWVAVKTIGYNYDGVRKTQILGYWEKENDARRALEQSQFMPVTPKVGITLENLYEEWSDVKYEYISKSARQTYEAAWKYLDELRKARFSDLRTVHFQKVINKSDKSFSSLSKLKSLCTMLYDYAMQNDIVMTNYASFLQLPQNISKEKQIFSDIEIKKLWDNIDVPNVDTILMLIYTGFRIGEFLALTPFNIDLNNQTITGGSKTTAGKNRAVPIHPDILPLVRERYDVANQRLIVRNGNVITTNYYRDFIFNPIMDRLKIKGKTPHSARHTCASLLAKGGADTLSIQKIMGHTNYALTANIYTHSDIESLKKAIGKI